jgi:FecR-like protein
LIRNGLSSLVAATFASVAIAKAEPTLRVGEAEIIRNQVVSVNGAELLPIAVGDAVVRDEVVSTSANSDARIGLIDNTKLALGPNSTLKIDRAVYSEESRYKQIVISLTEGAFRFVTGRSDKKSYRIDTPTASIGVRGTILDILISENKTLVTLQDGQANVCAGTKCTQLLQRGHTADVTRAGGAIQIRRDLVPTWTFASICSNNSQLCSPLPSLTRKASLSTSVPKPANGLKQPTRVCPGGQIMMEDRCVPDPMRDTSLPGLNDFARNTVSPTAPTVTPPEQVLGGSIPAARVGAPAIGGGGGLSLPRLGR